MFWREVPKEANLITVWALEIGVSEPLASRITVG
jgi:hypothetical protein